MKATIPLINALREAAGRIEQDRHQYHWNGPSKCNCGILTQCVVGMAQSPLHALLRDAGLCIWSADIKDVQRCAVTGMPMREVLDKLEAVGCNPTDFVEIENLNNLAVRQRAGLQTTVQTENMTTHVMAYGDYDDHNAVVKYFRAQADILEEQLAEQFETRPLTLCPTKLKSESRPS